MLPGGKCRVGDLLRVIRDAGSADPETDPKLSDSEAVRLYRLMMMERILDTRMLALQRQVRVRFHGPHTRARAMPLVEPRTQFMGNGADAVRGRQMPCHYVYRKGKFMSISSCVGTQIPLAVGTAWASRISGDNIVTLTYFGDGGTSTADFHVGMNFAGVFKTPTVFVCNNNQWAISVPVAQQTLAGTIAQHAGASRLPPVRADRVG